MKILEKVFSIKNDSYHKIVTIMGIKTKIKNKTKFKLNNLENSIVILQKQITQLKSENINLKNIFEAEITSLENSFHIYNKNYKYIHFVNNGIHSVDLIKFINNNLNKNEEHCFVFPIVYFDKTREALNNEKHIYFCKIKHLKNINISKYIIHGLFDTALVEELYKTPEILKKAYWYIWGGDLYNYNENEIANYVRKNVAGIITPFDKSIYELKLNCTKPHFDIPYDVSLLKYSKINKEKKDFTHILVNNCADSTTLEMLQILSKFKDENIKISTILSYIAAGQENCKEEIIKTGQDLFGNKFSAIEEFLPLEKYAEFLNGVDIYISNQNRQQGQGNASFLLSQGKKVYIKADTSVYKRYAELGIFYSDTNLIKNLDFKEFININSEIQEKTVEKLKQRQSIDFILKQWREFLLYGGNCE